MSMRNQSKKANTGIKHVKTACMLEGDVNKLEDKDLMIDRKLERMKLRYEEVKNKFKS